MIRRDEEKRGVVGMGGGDSNYRSRAILMLCSDLKRARGQTSSLTYYISMKKTTSLKANVVP